MDYTILVIESKRELQPRLETMLSAIREQTFFTLTNFADKTISVQSVHQSGNLADYIILKQPQLIILDPFYMAQDKNGFQWCGALKKNRDTDSIPLFLSKADTNNLETFRLKSLTSGANDFVVLSESPTEYEMQKVWAKIQFALTYEQKIRQANALTQEMNQLNDEIYKRNQQIEKDLYVARQLQQSLLPEPIQPKNPATEESGLEFQLSKLHYESDTLRVSGLYLPCDALGGDLYDVMSYPEEKALGITIADVSGHGVPAGFITAIFKSMLYRATHIYKDPKDIFYSLNNELASIVVSGDYVTSLYCRLSMDGRDMVYSGAGHPYPMLYQKETGQLIRLTENGPPLVWFENMDYPSTTVTLAPGDKLLIFTDGVSEMKNPEREMFGEDSLEKIFLEHVNQSGQLALDAMAYKLSDFTEGHPLEDDVSMVLIEVLS